MKHRVEAIAEAEALLSSGTHTYTLTLVRSHNWYRSEKYTFPKLFIWEWSQRMVELRWNKRPFSGWLFSASVVPLLWQCCAIVCVLCVVRALIVAIAVSCIYRCIVCDLIFGLTDSTGYSLGVVMLNVITNILLVFIVSNPMRDILADRPAKSLLTTVAKHIIYCTRLYLYTHTTAIAIYFTINWENTSMNFNYWIAPTIKATIARQYSVQMCRLCRLCLLDSYNCTFHVSEWPIG